MCSNNDVLFYAIYFYPVLSFLSISSQPLCLLRRLVQWQCLQMQQPTVAGSSEQNNHDQEDSSTIVLALQLNVGDRVDINLPPGCFLCDDSHYNTFSGFLLYPTE
uniref:Uncharacterized protein n=1 Tax=Lates calcarifer TaxID=8187 RepID=A0A4W6DS92_LATCA